MNQEQMNELIQHVCTETGFSNGLVIAVLMLAERASILGREDIDFIFKDLSVRDVHDFKWVTSRIAESLEARKENESLDRLYKVMQESVERKQTKEHMQI